MRIARPEIAIMVIFGIMVPTGDNYSDVWLSYKFFTGSYVPAGKFLVALRESDDFPRGIKYYEPVGEIKATSQFNFGIATMLPVLISFLFAAAHWYKTEDTACSRLKTLPLLFAQVWPQYRTARILYFYKRQDDRWVKEKAHHETELSSLGKYFYLAGLYTRVQNVWSPLVCMV